MNNKKCILPPSLIKDNLGSRDFECIVGNIKFAVIDDGKKVLLWMLISGIWCAQHTIPEYKEMQSRELLTALGVSFIHLKNNKLLVHLENKSQVKIITYDLMLGNPIDGVVYNKIGISSKDQYNLLQILNRLDGYVYYPGH